MSYLHCPTCKRAYNVAVQATCPYCPVHATPVDATEDIVVAAEQLARAMARATEAERVAAAARMDRLALPAPGPRDAQAPVLRSIRDVLAPPVIPPARPTLLVQLVGSLERRVDRLWARRPALLDRAAAHVRARVKALAQAT